MSHKGVGRQYMYCLSPSGANRIQRTIFPSLPLLLRTTTARSPGWQFMSSPSGHEGKILPPDGLAVSENPLRQDVQGLPVWGCMSWISTNLLYEAEPHLVLVYVERTELFSWSCVRRLLRRMALGMIRASDTSSTLVNVQAHLLHFFVRMVCVRVWNVSLVNRRGCPQLGQSTTIS